MKTAADTRHDESWLLLPWLANGRLTGAQRTQVEAHVRECPACAQEAATQRRMVALLTAPERVTYASGPSLRKLLERIDAEEPSTARPTAPAPRARRRGGFAAASWRPPGLAWAATFVLAVTLGLMSATAYRWSQPLYATYTAGARPTGEVLHIAFERTVPVGEVEEVLRSAGARVVEGPGTSGVFGVVPLATLSRPGAGSVSPEMRALAARLHADARVRWIEPLAPAPPAADAQGPGSGKP
jgi:hypothetical protein